MYKIAIPLEITEISAEILPVVRHLFKAKDTELTLLTVAQPQQESILLAEGHMMSWNSAAYLEEEDSEAWQNYRNELKRKIEVSAQKLRAEGYTVYTTLLTGNIISEIANFVDSRPFDLLAMATFGRKGLSRLVYGSVAEELLRTVSTPMLLARHHAESPKATLTKEPLAQEITPPETTPKEQTTQPVNAPHSFTIAAATDGTQHTQDALLVAAHLARALRADLSILVNVRGRDGVAHGQQVMTMTRQLLSHVDPQPEFVPLVGPPDEVLSQHLDIHPTDLLVIGAFKDRGSGGTADIGLTAQRLAQYATMPVLVFKGQHQPFERLLAYVALDDQTVIESALRLSRSLGTQLRLLHTLPMQAGALSTLLQPEDSLFQLQLTKNARLASFLDTVHARLHDEGMARDSFQLWGGNPNKTILDIAKEGHFDLIIIGAHPHPGFFPESLANYIVRYAPTSVLVVRQ